MNEAAVIHEIDGVVIDASVTTVPTDRTFRDAWKLDGEVVSIDQVKAAEIVKAMIEQKAMEVSALGIVWNGDTFGYKNVDDRDLKASILQQLIDGETNPHGGYIKDASGASVTLSDVEALSMLKKLRLYILQVVQASHAAKDNLPIAYVELFDPVTDVTWPSNVFLNP